MIKHIDIKWSIRKNQICGRIKRGRGEREEEKKEIKNWENKKVDFASIIIFHRILGEWKWI